MIDYSTLSLKVGSVLPTSTPAFNITDFSSSRPFTGGLGLPKLDEEEDDDRSICE
jgi:hypothetical protein